MCNLSRLQQWCRRCIFELIRPAAWCPSNFQYKASTTLSSLGPHLYKAKSQQKSWIKDSIRKFYLWIFSVASHGNWLPSLWICKRSVNITSGQLCFILRSDYSKLIIIYSLQVFSKYQINYLKHRCNISLHFKWVNYKK